KRDEPGDEGLVSAEVPVQRSQRLPEQHHRKISRLKKASESTPPTVSQGTESGLAEADRLPQEQTDTGQPNGLVVALHRKAGHRCSYLGHFGMSGFIICVLHSKNLQANSESLDANHFIQDKSLR